MQTHAYKKLFITRRDHDDASRACMQLYICKMYICCDTYMPASAQRY